MIVTGSDVVAHARKYMGVRWAHQGRSPAGMDCAGLVIRVAQDLGLSEFNTTAYGRLPLADRLQAIMREQCTELPGGVARAAPGHCVLMKFETDPQHLAFIGDHTHGLSLIHALMLSRKVVEHRMDPQWSGRVVAVYALPGVSY